MYVRGRGARRTETGRRDIAERLPLAQVRVAATRARSLLLYVGDLQADARTLVVGADSPGKQELDAKILEVAELLLGDSLQQCLRLGELQHAPHLATRAIEVGRFCESGEAKSAGIGITVADFTGVEIEGLFIAELCYEKLLKQRERARPGSQPIESISK
jgi:ornithine cyclodeaminase